MVSEMERRENIIYLQEKELDCFRYSRKYKIKLSHLEFPIKIWRNREIDFDWRMPERQKYSARIHLDHMGIKEGKNDKKLTYIEGKGKNIPSLLTTMIFELKKESKKRNNDSKINEAVRELTEITRNFYKIDRKIDNVVKDVIMANIGAYVTLELKKSNPQLNYEGNK